MPRSILSPKPQLVSLLLLLSICTTTKSYQESHVSVDISNKGLNFIKDFLIQTAISSLVPLELPQIQKNVKIPFLGYVDMVLSNISIYEIGVSSSTVKAGDSGVIIDVSGATANMSMQWKYSYSTWSWLIPIEIYDKGEASIQVKGMDIGLTADLRNQDGTLRLSPLECGCYVQNIDIKLEGGSSWLYQGLVDAFDDKITSAVEDAVSKNIRDGIIKLDSVLQSLPKEVAITEIAVVNVTFVNEPVLTNTSLGLEVDGLFSLKGSDALSEFRNGIPQASIPPKLAEKMANIAVHENVLESALLVYYEADKMHWIIDEVPDKSLLNTAGWRFIIPRLYKDYPNDDMNLDVSISSPPIIKILEQQIDMSVSSDVIIDVLNAGKVVQVACLSMVVSASANAEVSGNTLYGSVKLKDFTVDLKWSKIGSFHMFLIQPVMSTVLKTVVVPYLNSKLGKGIMLPTFHDYKLENAEIIYTNSWIVLSSDVASIQQYYTIKQKDEVPSLQLAKRKIME